MLEEARWRGLGPGVDAVTMEAELVELPREQPKGCQGP
jgi:hypothetical protein